MKDENKLKVIGHSIREFPREACGLLVIKDGIEEYIECENTSVDTDKFKLKAENFAAIEREATIIAVVHSHTVTDPAPSEIDIASCDATGLPWYIYSIRDESWSYFEPKNYTPPFIGRSYNFGCFDCYAIARDFYKEKYKIYLPQIKTGRDFYKEGKNFFISWIEAAGFREVSDLKEGDLILMQIGGQEPNHLAVFIEPNTILHHPEKRLSCRETYGDFFRKKTKHIIRHQRLM